MNYYKRLKDCREDNDLTQQQISDYLKINRGTYSMYECGCNIIPLPLLDKLSIKYTVSIDYLVGLSNKHFDKCIEPMNFSILCKRLKEQRIKYNLTQLQISKYLNITQSHYATYENGHNTIPITKLIKLSTKYKVSVDFLMGKKD